MGVSNVSPGSVLWMGSGLSINQLKHLKLGHRIDVDGNALAWKLGSGKPINSIIDLMAKFLKSVAFGCGFEVTVVFDGFDRPDCKRASWERKKMKDLDDVNRLYCRFKALETGRLMHTAIDANQKKELENEYKQFSAASKRLESKLNKCLVLPKDMASLLSERLMLIGACDRNEDGGIVFENIITSKFQADSVIALRSKQKKSDFILSEDTDFVALLGNECILIKNIFIQNTKVIKRGRPSNKRKCSENDDVDNNTSIPPNQDITFQIAGTCNLKMNTIRNSINSRGTEEDASISWIEAKSPILSYSNPYLRALCALVLGCDVFKGITGVGVERLYQKIKEYDNEENAVAGLIEFISNRLNQDSSVVDTLMKSFMCEPGLNVDVIGNEISPHSAEEVSPYIFTPPSSLPKFLETFRVKSIVPRVESGPEFCLCKGSRMAGSAHTYLSFEGNYKCVECNDNFCYTCVFIPTKDKGDRNNKLKEKIYYKNCDSITCLDCFRSMRLGNKDTNMNVFDNKEIKEMRRELRTKIGLQLDDRSVSMSETVDLYECYISSPTSTLNMMKCATDTVKFPVLPATYVENMRPNSSNDGNVESFVKLGVFNIQQGGCFISDDTITSNDDLADVLELISTVLDQTPKESVQQRNDIGEFGYLPTLFHDFAFNSRVGSGYRLIARCARHACDPRTPSIITANVVIFRYKGKYEKNGR